MNNKAALFSGFTHDLDGGLERVAGPVDEPAGEALSTARASVPP
jgi:hypothetical protein